VAASGHEKNGIFRCIHVHASALGIEVTGSSGTIAFKEVDVVPELRRIWQRLGRSDRRQKSGRSKSEEISASHVAYSIRISTIQPAVTLELF
jgi:hypothetical protein